MGILLSRLLMPVVLIVILIMLFRRQARSRGKHAHRRESCPACQTAVRLPGGEPGVCPACGTALARSPDGRLRIRVG